MSQDPIARISEFLLTKSSVKQQTYRNVMDVFKGLKKQAISLIEVINSKTDTKDEDIILSVNEISDQEFHVKVAGDLLVFFLHTNVITLSDEYAYNKSPYVQENAARKYLGQINVYNFMADSFKYNRLNDPGYLLARLMVNFERRFIAEGDRQIKFMFESVSGKPIENTDLNIFLQLIISQAIENDLVVPPFQKIRNISVQQKMAQTALLGAGNKIGFQMRSQDEVE